MKRQDASYHGIFQTLEPRMLLAGISLGSDGVLTITGTEAGDEIEVQIRSDDPSRVKVELNTTERRFDRSAVTSIVVNALGGNDFVEIGKDDEPVAIRSYIFGGAGNDNLDGGASGDSIRGGEGNDDIDGEGGNDKLYGDAGRDSIEGSGGKDRLFGGAGRDSLEGGSGADTLQGGSSTDTLQGGPGVDTLIQ